MGWPAPPDPGLDLAVADVDPADHAGDRIQAGGVVVDTDPVVIEVEADGPGEEPQLLTLENAPPVAEGQNVIVAGELTDDGTLQVDPDRAIVREPWEVLYMYGISTFAALLIAGRGINGWTVDRETWSVVPRDVPLHERLRTKEARDD